MNTFDSVNGHRTEQSREQNIPAIDNERYDATEHEPAYAALKGGSGRAAGSQAAAIGKLIAGTAIAAVGVPMLVLPGPGIAAIAVGGLIAAKGASELTGKENPVITQIEDHPEYQAAAQKAKEATATVTDAVADAAKEIPGVVAGAGKAVIDAVDDNLPENVRGAVDSAKPVVKSAAKVGESAVHAVGKGVNAGVKALGNLAENIRTKM